MKFNEIQFQPGLSMLELLGLGTPKLQQGGRVGNDLLQQIDAFELARGLAVVDRIFHGFVGQAEILL